MVRAGGQGTKLAVASGSDGAIGPGRARLAKELFGGGFGVGQTVQLREIAAEYELDEKSVLQTFTEFQALGMATLGGDLSAVVHSASPKEMHEAYEIRAALEEISGRTAAPKLKGNTAELQRLLEGMRKAVREGDLDDYAELDAKFHRGIVESSQNDVLMRVWEALTFDLRIRAAIGRAAAELPEVVESHQPILNALEKGRGREAGLLLRNHVETFLEYLKKSESDSGFRRTIRRDLQGAKDVQQAFFPPVSLSIPCLACETFYQPVQEIGGDYYDFISLQGGRWGIAIGDVSGKGIGAALIMASLQASLRSHALHSQLELSELIGDVNRLVYESSPKHFFASLFYAEYEPATRVLKYVNAGHNAPLVLRPRKGTCEMFRLDSASMPVGISADTAFSSATFQFEVNDILVAYTDGITEMENQKRELWGEEKLENLLRTCSRRAPEQIIKRILNGVRTFANGQPQRDDMTLIVMRMQEGCEV
ncbi:MAG TPA: SpoIIE family protein phosphatase [Candidatus Acidoferrum sp.]